MLYQSSGENKFQSHPWRRSIVILLTHSLGEKGGFNIFSKCISPKVIGIEFELIYFGVAVQHFGHYARKFSCYGFKYSYPIEMIQKELYGFKKLFLFIELFRYSYVGHWLRTKKL